jgi:hypothetical protein
MDMQKIIKQITDDTIEFSACNSGADAAAVAAAVDAHRRNSISILIHYVILGAFTESTDTATNHQFPTVLHELLRNPNKSISLSFAAELKRIALTSSSATVHVNLYHKVHLIDPNYAAMKCEGIFLPKNIIHILQDINYESACTKVTDIFTTQQQYHSEAMLQPYTIQYTSQVQWHIYPFECMPLINALNTMTPILKVISPNVLLLYFDMTEQNAGCSPMIVAMTNPTLYSIESNCMMRYDMAETMAYLDVAPHDALSPHTSVQWLKLAAYPEIIRSRYAEALRIKSSAVELPDVNGIRYYLSCCYDYMYRTIIVSAISDSLPYLENKSVYHIATGSQHRINDISLIALNISNMIDTMVLPLLRYRCTGHKYYHVIMWYYSTFRDDRQNFKMIGNHREIYCPQIPLESLWISPVVMLINYVKLELGVLGHLTTP